MELRAEPAGQPEIRIHGAPIGDGAGGPSPDLKAAHASMQKAAEDLQRFMRRTEDAWTFLVMRKQLPRKEFYKVYAARDVDGLRLLLKKHMVEILRDYPTQEEGRYLHRLRIFKGDREVARKSFVYTFNQEKKTLQVVYEP